MKFLYITRLKELDVVSQFRFELAFMIAIYSTLLAPIIIKLQGVYLLVQVITLYMIIENLSFKFLEPIVERFIIGHLWRILVLLHGIEGIIILTYFWRPDIFIYLYLAIDLLLKIVAKSYGIKQTNLFSKLYPGKVKKLQVFQVNIWSEGFLIGLVISGILQNFSIDIVVAIAFLFHFGIMIYMIKHLDFYDKYFKNLDKSPKNVL